MTKNAAAKKAARDHAAATGSSYAAARRHTRHDAPGEPLTVWVSYEFAGPNAPASFKLNATWWLEALAWHQVVSLQQNNWIYNPSGPDGSDYLPPLLDRVVDQHPQLENAAAWVAAHTTGSYQEFTVPDQHALTGEVTLADHVTTVPYRMTFDAPAAQRWFDGRGPVYHLDLSDFVTPAERREWLDLQWPGRLDCSAGRHYFDGHPSPYMGECVGCGALMLGKFTYDGDEYQDIVDEEEFFVEAIATEAACDWAPPTRMLDGETQSAWSRRNRQPFAWS